MVTRIRFGDVWRTAFWIASCPTRNSCSSRSVGVARGRPFPATSIRTGFPAMAVSTQERSTSASRPLGSIRLDRSSQIHSRASRTECVTCRRRRRSESAAAPGDVSSWLATPSVVAVAGGNYSFGAASGATLHAADIESTNGERLWAVTIFDGSTSFTLPTLTPDPIPAGSARLKVSALKIPGVDLNDVVFDELQDEITALSTNAITFTH